MRASALLYLGLVAFAAARLFPGAGGSGLDEAALVTRVLALWLGLDSICKGLAPFLRHFPRSQAHPGAPLPPFHRLAGLDIGALTDVLLTGWAGEWSRAGRLFSAAQISCSVPWIRSC